MKLLTGMLVVLIWTSRAFCGEIHEAAGNGDLEKLKTLLKDDPNLVFSTDKGGRTPLHWAAYKNHKDAAELLLGNKAEVDAKDKFDATPLMAAIAGGHKDAIQLLLTSKADVNVKNNEGSTSLLIAASKGSREIAELLLGNKAEVNAKANDGRTPLHAAALFDRKNVVELLIANKAEVNARPSAAGRLCTMRRLRAIGMWWNCCWPTKPR